MDNTSILNPAPTMRDRLPLWMLYTANAISMVGNVLTALAIPWFVLQVTGSAEKAGLTGFFAALPIALAAFLGGSLVDRLGLKRMSVVADIASGVTVAMIPILYVLGGLEFTWLLVLVFFTNLLDAPGSTAREALVPELAERAGVSLESASSMNQIVERSSRLIGAPLAGALIALVGATTVLWIDATSFFVSAALIAFLVRVAAKAKQAHEGHHWRSELLDGVNFIRRDRLLLAIVITVMITNLLDNGVLMTIYIQQTLDSAVALGLSVAVSGGGAVIGALIFGSIGKRLPRRTTFIVLFILLSVRYFIYALYPPLAIIILVQFLTGLAAGPINPLLNTVEYERVPVDLRGRVFGALTAGAMMAVPLGALFTGIAIENFGLVATLLVVGVAYLGTTGALLFNPAMYDMDKRVAEASSATTTRI